MTEMAHQIKLAFLDLRLPFALIEEIHFNILMRRGRMMTVISQQVQTCHFVLFMTSIMLVDLIMMLEQIECLFFTTALDRMRTTSFRYFRFVPRYSVGFEVDFVPKGRYISFKISQIQPDYYSLIAEFEPKDVVALDGKVLLYVLKFKWLLANGYVKDVGSIRVIFVLRNVIKYQRHFFFLHVVILRNIMNNLQNSLIILDYFYKR